jgi:aminotransferase
VSPWTRFIARHVVDLPKSGIRDFFEIVSKMKDVISLGIGEPDFDTPWHIREAAIYALEKGKTHYTSNLGLIELRRAISKYVERNTPSATAPRTRSSSRSACPRRSTWRCARSSTRATRCCTTSPATSPTIPSVTLAHGVAVPVPTRADGRLRAQRRGRSRRLAAGLQGAHDEPAVQSHRRHLRPRAPREDRPFAVEKDLIVLSDEIYSELVTRASTRASPAFPA